MGTHFRNAEKCGLRKNALSFRNFFRSAASPFRGAASAEMRTGSKLRPEHYDK